MKTYIGIMIFCASLLGFGCSDKNNTESIDYQTIDALIADCRTEVSQAVEGSDLGEYVIGSKVIFTKAIDDTEYVRENTNRQSALNNYAVKLNVARSVFRDSKVAMACPYFNGEAYIDCGPAEKLISTVFTVEIWVKMASNTGLGAAILGAEGSDGSTWDGFMLRRAEGIDKALDFCVVNGMWSSCLTPVNSFAFERWTHVACTFDGRVAKIYLDGVESSTMTIGEYPMKCWGNLMIGDMAFFRGRYLIGNAYDLRIWNTVRSAEQIKDNMNSLLEANEEGLVANWKFNVKGSTSVTDATGKHTATLHGITWADLDRIVE